MRGSCWADTICNAGSFRLRTRCASPASSRWKAYTCAQAAELMQGRSHAIYARSHAQQAPFDIEIARHLLKIPVRLVPVIIEQWVAVPRITRVAREPLQVAVKGGAKLAASVGAHRRRDTLAADARRCRRGEPNQRPAPLTEHGARTLPKAIEFRSDARTRMRGPLAMKLGRVTQAAWVRIQPV